MLDSIIGFSIRYRVIVILATIALIIGGFWAYSRLPIEAFPDVLNETVQVITQVPGQAAQDVERMVTAPLEREFSSIPRVIQSRSISEFGLSVIYLTFDDGVDGYWARTQVTERFATANIPPNVTPNLAPMSSVIGEIFRYEVTGTNQSATDLRTLEEWTLEQQFRSIPGVADVTSYGGLLKTIEVAVNPFKLSTYNVSIRSLADTITGASTNSGGNLMNWPNQSFVVRSDGEVKSLDDLRNVGLVQRGNTAIRVRDIGSVYDSNAPVRGVVGRDDRDNIVQGIVLLRKGDNPITTGHLVGDKVAALNHGTLLPEGVKLKKYYDRIELVEKTTHTVAHNLLEGVGLVCGVLYLFLENIPATLLVASVVPLSLLFAFLCMVLSHTPANLISLGSIDFGIIIDGALIIVEYTLVQTALRANHSETMVQRSVSEIVRSVFFSMVMIIIAYLPIFTLQRVEGKMFGPLAWTVSFALTGALLASLTYIPALLPWVLGMSAHSKENSSKEHEPRWLGTLRGRYLDVLDLCTRQWKRILLAAAGLLSAGLLVFAFSGSEFLPELDEGALWIRTSFPHSTSLEEGIKLAHKIRTIIRTNPEVRTVVSQLGGPEDGTDPNLFDNCEFFVDLRPKEEWRRFHHEREELIESLRTQLGVLPGIGFNISQPIADNVEEAISGVKGKNAVKIYGADLKVLDQLSAKISDVIQRVPGAADVGPIASMPMVPQMTIRLDRSKVAHAGVSLQDINDLVEIAVGGKKTAAVYDGPTRIDVMVRADERFRTSIESIRKLPVPLPNNKLTTLEDLASIQLVNGPLVINHESGYRRTGVKFNVAGRDLGSTMREVQTALSNVEIPAGYFTVIGGEYENQKRAMSRLMVVVPATLVLIGILLFILYSNLSYVAVILGALILATTGSIFLLFLRGIPFSVPAAVGILVLFGLMALDSVALTSSFGRLLKELTNLGDPDWNIALQAMNQACRERFRPILMTSSLAGLGLLPAALSHGIGAETQRPLATAVIGGIFTGLPVVLFVLPLLLVIAAVGIAKLRKAS